MVFLESRSAVGTASQLGERERLACLVTAGEQVEARYAETRPPAVGAPVK
jgi:hypothetical protein